MNSLMLGTGAQKQLSNAYAEAQGPFPPIICGQDFVLMSMADFEEYCGHALADDNMESLRQDYAEALRGELYDAREMLAEIRAEHKI